MFRSLAGKVQKIQKELDSQNKKSSELNSAFSRFLEEYFPEGKVFNYKVEYDSNGKITIKTENKAIANELFLRIKDFSRILKEKNIDTQQIIII